MLEFLLEVLIGRLLPNGASFSSVAIKKQTKAAPLVKVHIQLTKGGHYKGQSKINFVFGLFSG
jgi:hypothetical protein